MARGQATSSVVEVVTVFSQNGRFFLKSIPYDNEFPSLRGKTYVYQTGKADPLYEFERGFDSVDDNSNNLILSNDGETIFFAIPWEADESIDGLKSVTIYRHGTIIKSFTETEVNGCDKKTERCSLLYNNYETVVDKEKSNFGSKYYRKTFKAGVDEKEIFLNDFPIFSFDDKVYLTDSRKVVHSFDLKTATRVSSDPFNAVFESLKSKGRFNRVELAPHDAPIMDFPKLRDGRDSYNRLANILGMKRASIFGTKDDQYALHSFKINATISRDGTVEIENSEFWDDLPRDKVLEFFKENRFDTTQIPSVFAKWNLGDEYFYFRNRNDRLARLEKRKRDEQDRRDYEERLLVEKINGVYIPKDLGECFLELDKALTEVDKKEMRTQPSRNDMINYHLGLGMWMRNNWGLWGGSRLQKYFRGKGITHPEDMSSIILFYYYDWLTGRTETWKQWEKKPERPFTDSADQHFTNTINRPRP